MLEKNNNNNYKDNLLEKIKKDALEIGIGRNLSSGKKSNYYIDGKMMTLDSEGAFLTAKVIFDMIDSVDFDAIGGLTLGADPIVGALALFGYINNKPIQTFIVRKEPKKHGTMKLIEGKLTKGSKVIIVDDVVTTGNSILQAIETVEKENCEVVKIIVLVDRQDGAREKFNSRGYEFEPIFTKEDLGITNEY